MRVPEEVRQCVVYLGLPSVGPDGQKRMMPIGTAFFVTIIDETLETWTYTYLVTARHVAQELDAHEFTVRINTVGGGAVFVTSGPGLRWWYHATDQAVDVGLFPWAPPEHFEHKKVPVSMFLTDEIVRSKSIGTGDEVFMTGLFAHFAGSARNIPIVRMGNIAMMPQELVPTAVGNIEAYLIEARSIGGLSGSPAFVRETIPLGLGQFFLLGLVHGHWDIPADAINDALGPDAADHLARVNMGIAIVVPAKKILEVLNCQELVEIRRLATEAERRRRQLTLPDTAAP